ncbi:hypothetical protein A6R68_18269, partial [Neotoma lepida]
ENQLNIGKGEPKKMRRKCPHRHSLRKLAGKSTRKAPGCFCLSAPRGSLRSTQRGERLCLLKKRENLKTLKRLTVLIYYCPEIKGEHPGLPIGDVAKKLGAMWNKTPADDRKPCEKKAAELKEKYEKDIAAYRTKGNPDAVRKGLVTAERARKTRG